MGKLFIIIGILFVIAGLFIVFSGGIPFLGRLPGDIAVKGENHQFYFPIVTCLLISFIVSLLLYLFR
ncbi:MAG: DUF2905 domain-containing protein [Parachlamydia sp.]|jgi:hypothetical protein|nr:DUF2905 domain-containing protein [Parachlamydia sp.]